MALGSIPRRRLTHGQRDALVRRAARGDEAARNTVITHMLPLVVKLANRVARGFNRLDLLDDLTQAAIMGSGTTASNGGLLRAIELFDPKRSGFVAYASQWILVEMRQVMHALGCSAPREGGRAARIRKAAQRFAARHGADPTPLQCACECRRDPRTGRFVAGRAAGMAMIANVLAGPPRETSYDAIDPCGSDAHATAQGNEDDLIATLDARYLSARLAAAIATLPPHMREAAKQGKAGEEALLLLRNAMGAQ